MTKARNCRKHLLAPRILFAIASIACLSAAAIAADHITGAVQNQSRNQAAAGDQVILLRLDQGMQEEARTSTDEFGAFTIKVQVPDKPHLVRVMHRGVNYDRQAAAGDSLTIDVFDAAAKVQGITGGIEIIRTGTNGKKLHVSDMIEIKNDSRPPITKAGKRTFHVYLPSAARIDSVLAATSGKIGVLIAASPVAGEPGHFTVNFPLRPGSTKFAFNYDIPYSGHAAFRTRLAYPVHQLAVMIPPTMKFASRSQAFQALATGNNDYQVQATNELKAGEGPSFEISGAGALPQLDARSRPPSASQAVPAPPGPARGPAPAAITPQPLPPASDVRNATPAPVLPLSPSPPLNEWWILAAAAVLVLGACAFLIWKTSRRPASATSAVASLPNASGTSALLLDALKSQLLELETGRLDGSISSEEYDAAKLALEGTVKRALARLTAGNDGLAKVVRSN